MLGWCHKSIQLAHVLHRSSPYAPTFRPYTIHAFHLTSSSDGRLHFYLMTPMIKCPNWSWGHVGSSLGDSLNSVRELRRSAVPGSHFVAALPFLRLNERLSSAQRCGIVKSRSSPVAALRCVSITRTPSPWANYSPTAYHKPKHADCSTAEEANMDRIRPTKSAPRDEWPLVEIRRFVRRRMVGASCM